MTNNELRRNIAAAAVTIANDESYYTASAHDAAYMLADRVLEIVAPLLRPPAAADVPDEAIARIAKALDIPSERSLDRLAVNVEWLRENYRRMCDRLQAVCQKHHLGLGGEHIDELVCDQLDRRLTQEAVAPKKWIVQMLCSDGETWAQLGEERTAFPAGYANHGIPYRVLALVPQGHRVPVQEGEG